MQSKIVIILLCLLGASFVAIDQTLDKPKVTRLSISECIEDCEDPDRVTSEVYTDHIYKIKFGMLLNCCGQDSLSVKLKGDTLKIRILPKRKNQFKVEGADGDSTWTTVTCSCNCYYKFDAEITNLPYPPKVVSVNKKLLTKL